MYRKGKVRCQPGLRFEGEFEFIAVFSILEKRVWSKSVEDGNQVEMEIDRGAAEQIMDGADSRAHW